jgi:hypothetical protein
MFSLNIPFQIKFTTTFVPFQDTDWVDDIRKTMSQLKKNSASLKRQSSQFEPMRKPDILKLRRESLSKIMLSRKTEESRRQLLKGTVS